jgi:tetratricopeptide (TPR) repeat protein
LNGLRSAEGFEIRGEPLIEDTALADGTKAQRVRVAILRPERRRLSLYEKVYCAAPDGRLIVATGFLTCGPAGGTFLERTGLAAFLRAHVASLSLDADRIDRRKLEADYGTLDVRTSEAIHRTGAGNCLLGVEDYGRAAANFREALKLCDAVSAAHNGLAWALLQAKGAKGGDVTEGVLHAEAAVELTQRRDPAALDTLALAYFQRGDREKAVATVREALKLNPGDPDLRRSLERYQKGS